MKSLFEINSQIIKSIDGNYQRPEQLMDQTKFNAIMLNELNILALQRSKGKRNFQITPENEWLLKVVFAYLNRNADDNELTYTRTIQDETITKTLDLHKGLMLLGNFGVGKTLLMQAIHSKMQMCKLTGRFVSSRKIYETKQVDWDVTLGKPQYGIFIDDLGDEPTKTVEFGNEDAPVALVLKNRMDAWEQLPESPKMFITSNCAPKVLEQKYGGRIVSRMHAAMNVIITNQKTDWRKL